MFLPLCHQMVDNAFIQFTKVFFFVDYMDIALGFIYQNFLSLFKTLEAKLQSVKKH